MFDDSSWLSIIHDYTTQRWMCMLKRFCCVSTRVPGFWTMPISWYALGKVKLLNGCFIDYSLGMHGGLYIVYTCLYFQHLSPAKWSLESQFIGSSWLISGLNIFYFPYIGKNHPIWPIFFRGVAQPPTRSSWASITNLWASLGRKVMACTAAFQV